MTRSMPRPVRRLTATAVLTAVAGAGALAAAPVALADPASDGPAAADPAVVAPAVTPPAAPPKVSPLPKEPVTVKINGFTLQIQPVVVQVVQTVVADYLAQQGQLYTYDSKGRLVIGPKICDSKKNAAANKGCVAVDAPRAG